MRIVIDTDSRLLTIEDHQVQRRALSLYSEEAFAVLSDQWVRVGWAMKYTYGFSWLGRPIIQLPEDLIRIQEVIWDLRPDVIVETGVAHGGSLVFYAGLCRLLGRGRVIGVDIEIRSHNRKAIEEHDLASSITLVEGSSTDPAVVERVRSLIRLEERVLVLLDSCHTKAHVAAELEAYHTLVTPRSYLVVTDGVMRQLADVPRGTPEWVWDNPAAAAIEFAARHPEFVLQAPPRPFNEGSITAPVTHWPDAWLHRVR